jgi:hypothetical protein
MWKTTGGVWPGLQREGAHTLSSGRALRGVPWSMIRKSGDRFSEKIMLNKKIERDDDSKKSHPALVLQASVKVLIDQFLMVMQEMSERFRVRQTASA